MKIKDAVSYVLTIEGRPYTLHLQQHVFLSDDFRIYVSNEKGSLRSDSTHIKGGCYYRGYIDGFPSSAVTLSTCSGLRDAPAASLEGGWGTFTARKGLLVLCRDPLPAAARSPKYFKVYVVLDKALYNYMGSDTNAATQKIIQVFNLVNNMFNPVNVTIVLSSLELWTEENKISTAGEADDLLQRFLQWKQSYLALRSYDVAYLLVYRDRAGFVGATAPGKACQRCAAGAVAVVRRFSGAKAFSSCSIRDFETFLKHDGGACLFNRPRLTGLSYRRKAVCGNGVVEPGEQCDCGSAEACLKDKCCTKRCRFKPGVKCSSGLCCKACQVRHPPPPADAQCDLPEFCNGSSASCPSDLYVQDGHGCEHGTGYCYRGRCQSPDLQCQRLYGRGSKNAPVACYEELNSQRDRFGHCGFQPRQGYKSCAWRNLRCGKLICTYPYSTPFASDAAAVVYVQVREHLCVSLDYLNAPARLDPLLVPPGTKCGSGKVCINNTCHPHSVLGYDCDSEVKCHGHGVCNNKRHCHCHPGWKPPDCLRKGSRLGGSVDSGLRVTGGGLSLQRALEDATPAWQVLGSCLLLLVLAGAICLLLLRQDAVSYVLTIEGRPYTLHLQQHVFLSDDFRIYVSNEKGSLRSDSTHIKGGCYYRGYIDGFPSSAVTLSTCSGLRGLLQFENVSYGIEPLGYSPAFEHFVYRVSDEKTAGSLFANSHPERGPGGLTAEEMSYKAHGDDESVSKYQREMALHIVLERALYDYLGADEYVVTQKIVQVSSLLSSMFRSLNLTVTLSSMEVWMDNSTFKTTGDGEEVLVRLLEWKQTSPALQPHEVPYLLLYRDRAGFVGATAPGKACQRDAAGAVAVYQGAVTLESFSVLLAQLLGRSLGISYDDSPDCRCPGRICLMSPEALRFSGAKAFSSCSIRDFETFLKQNRDCPFIRHALRQPSYRAAICGNSIVEPGEQCDCGAPEACALDKCCTPQCNFKPGMKCSLGLCCENCQFKQKTSQCRPPADAQCDLPEFCNGSSASCPSDLYVQDGHGCEHGTGYCYKGCCQSPDLQCQALYGKGAKNAPLACYEEVNSQQDRFGHCGNHPKDGYQPCSWPNLGCGKLVCTYPNRIPFTKVKGAIIYAQVQEHLCVSFDFMHGPTALDPLLVKDGTKCGPGKVCMNGTCHPHSVLKYDCNVQKKCHGHGVCNNKKNCHCDPGWNPPKCKTQGSSVGGSIDSTLGPDHTAKSSALAVLNNWRLLLSFGVVLLALVCGTIMMTKWSRLKRFCRARTYIIPIEGTPRTVRLRQQVFLPEDFRIYTDGRGGLAKSELAHIKVIVTTLHAVPSVSENRAAVEVLQEERVEEIPLCHSAP
ncbi:PREDICTED: uncharacterized protein LOC103900352 [Aptenodytes forsteri]|uniref:uncharacterized protein LOC103900352 n=1 Tax=Aptenodytes forsteri TaxID=9233 RepID=UPI000905350A|nr:PREDICTED: uncharacterized protein LOC103900352 [Aptenodytes forsteri]